MRSAQTFADLLIELKLCGCICVPKLDAVPTRAPQPLRHLLVVFAVVYGSPKAILRPHHEVNHQLHLDSKKFRSMASCLMLNRAWSSGNPCPLKTIFCANEQVQSVCKHISSSQSHCGQLRILHNMPCLPQMIRRESVLHRKPKKML